MKNTYLYIKAVAVSLMLSLGLASCGDDDNSGPITVSFGEGAIMDMQCNINGLVAPNFAGSSVYNMYTNAKSWTVEADYSTSAGDSWIYIWPDHGNLDGRFSLTVAKNTTDGDKREATVTVKSGATVMQVITVSQDATTPTLKLVGGSKITDIEYDDAGNRVDSNGATFTKTILVSSNVRWIAQLDGTDVDWVTLTPKYSKEGFEGGSGTIELKVAANPTDVDRTATVSVYQTSDTQNYKTITVVQSAHK